MNNWTVKQGTDTALMLCNLLKTHPTAYICIRRRVRFMRSALFLNSLFFKFVRLILSFLIIDSLNTVFSMLKYM